MQHFLMLSLAALSISHAQELHKGNCPPVQPMKNFQLASYLGTWYDVKTYSEPYIVNHNCSLSIYSLGNDTSTNFVIKEINDSDGSAETKEGYAALVSAGVGEMEIFVDSEKTNLNYIVLGTDYNNWAAVYGCTYWPESSVHAVIATLLTKNRNPSQEHVQAALAVFKSQGVDPSLLYAVNQNNCDNL